MSRHRANVRRLQELIAPTGSRDFTFLWLGQGVSELGTAAAYTAWIWLLTDLTGSPALMGVVLAASALPALPLMFLGGVLADRGEPRQIALRAQLTNALLGGAFASLVALGRITVPTFIVIITLFGLVRSIFSPAMSALFPATVLPQLLNAANVLRQAMLQVAAILGPPLGGVLIASGGIGIALTFDTATFIFAAMTIALMRRPINGFAVRPAKAHAEMAQERNFVTDAVGGIRLLSREPGMLAVVALFACTNALNNVEAVLVPVLARTELGLSASAYGLVYTFLGAGSILGTIATGLLGSSLQRPTLAICGGLIAFGAAIIGLSAAHSAAHLYVAYAVLGVAFIVPEIVSVTLWQRMIPAGLRGRVFGLLSAIAMAVNPLGYLLAGGIGQAFGARLGLLAGGAMICCLGILALMFAPVRGLDERARAADAIHPSTNTTEQVMQ